MRILLANHCCMFLIDNISNNHTHIVRQIWNGIIVTFYSLLSIMQDCQPIKDLPYTHAVQTVGRWEDRFPGWPTGEICGELYHQKPARENARLPAKVCDRRPDFPGQRRGSDSLVIGHPAQDGQSALRYSHSITHSKVKDKWAPWHYTL